MHQDAAPPHALEVAPFTTRGLHPGINCCYRNAFLQMLFHVPVFAQWLRFHHNTAAAACNLPGCIACTLSNLLTVYWSTPAQSEAAAPFEEQVGAFHTAMMNGMFTSQNLVRAWSNLLLAGWPHLTTQECSDEFHMMTRAFIDAQSPPLYAFPLVRYELRKIDEICNG